MTDLPPSLRTIIDDGPLTHLATVEPDGTPQVSVVWIARDGDDLLTGHMSRHRKVVNLERDPRAVLSFLAPPEPGAFLQPYAVLRARATVTADDGTWDLLDRLAKVYLGREQEFPAPRGPGYVVRYRVERITGVGPWAGGS
jgi:PPOX class probable F420-dependent enzyme